MILLDIKKYFQESIDASVFDIAKTFKIQVSAAQGMIDFWMKRGHLEICNKACTKKSCSGCSVPLQRYRWVSPNV